MAPNTTKPWSPEQDELLREIYADQSQIELMKAFPNRSWSGIYDRAIELRLRRMAYQTNYYHRTMRYDDLEAVSRLVKSEQEKERIREIANSLARNTKRGNLSAHWWLPIKQISYTSLDESEGANQLVFNEEGIDGRWRQPQALLPEIWNFLRYNDVASSITYPRQNFFLGFSSLRAV
jgi:hypothetical protein